MNNRYKEFGVLVGSDASQEWLLAWFYAHFRKYNPDCPIAFADFGMSLDARNWCKERGPLQKVPANSADHARQGKFLFHGEYWQEWKLDISNWTPDRRLTLRKPFAIAQAPFQRILWLDLDCQVRGDLSPLLSMPLSSGRLSAAFSGSYCHVHNLSKKKILLIDKCNSGVILTEKNSGLLDQWISLIDRKVSFSTEEGSLSFLINRNQTQFTELSPLFNWPVHVWGENEESLVYHWIGKEAKCRLRESVMRIPHQ